MSDAVTIKLNQDELEILIDALAADQEGYIEAAKEARGNTRREEMETYTEAAERIQALINRLQELVEE